MTAYATTRNGFRLLPEYFDRVQQADLAAQVMGALQDAPLFTPSMPQALLELWEAVSGWPEPPQACLINVYGPQSRLGLHIDADEDAREAPVVSVSLGDRARFRLGGPQRSSPTRSLFLSSGDVVVLGGASRRFFHGVDRIYPGTSTLLSGPFSPGRINLTMRRVHTGGGAGTTRS